MDRSDRSEKFRQIASTDGSFRPVNTTASSVDHDPWKIPSQISPKIGQNLNVVRIETESMINMEISDVLKELDCLVTELNDFVCLSEKQCW